MVIDDINRKATELLFIKTDLKRIINHGNKVLEKQIKMESVNEIKINHKNRENWINITCKWQNRL